MGSGVDIASLMLTHVDECCLKDMVESLLGKLASITDFLKLIVGIHTF